MKKRKATYRCSLWFDTQTGKVKYGIQAKLEDGKWMHACEDGKGLVFDTKPERAAKLKELRAKT